MRHGLYFFFLALPVCPAVEMKLAVFRLQILSVDAQCWHEHVPLTALASQRSKRLESLSKMTALDASLQLS